MRQQSLTAKRKIRMCRLRAQGTAIRAIAAEVGCSYRRAQAFFRQ